MNRLNIEWRHLVEDGNTCERCDSTGQALKQVVASLSEKCRAGGWEINLTDTALGSDAIAESNSILLNGTPIEEILPGAAVGESHCESCCEILGSRTNCRTIEFGRLSLEAIPETFIRDAICRVAACC